MAKGRPPVPRKGLRITVADINAKDLGLGTIVGFKKMTLCGVKCDSPQIKLDSGRTIYGYECWWTTWPELNKKPKAKRKK